MGRYIVILFFMASNIYGQKLLPPVNGVYHSAFPDMGPTEDVVSIKNVQEFEILTGKDIMWAYFSDNWFDGINFPYGEADAIRKAGSIPFIRMMPRSDWTEGRQDPVYSLQNIIDGKFDTELRQYAQDAKKFSTPLLIEFGTEMNGDWFPWSGTYNEGPIVFRDAYRHIIDIFNQEGANNVTWFFHVNDYPAPSREGNSLKAYYPGDDYIDWIGVSIYGAQEPGEQYVQFSDVLDDVIAELSDLSPNKPLAILEFGAVDEPGTNNQSEWVRNALNYITSDKYPRIKAISYWHSKWSNDNGSVSDMRLDASSETLQIYTDIVSSDFFITKPSFSK
ncbi:MAG: hypothetical protein KDC73_13845 [Ignavibacteriae bacterium]|nr:hypothetical protein [Ignavibacteriota bacterium]MCB9244737.1 hypothetical protein [Ignavibacteriales bacterium]